MDRVYLDEIVAENQANLWVFAYGSLCWKPGFEFSKAVPGYVNGFLRRFWQGNVTHRGTSNNPGRVATLVQQEEGLVYGLAFSITDSTALPYLSQRECQQGGYISKFIEFYPIKGPPFKVLVYIATPLNPHWLGDANVEEIAAQIANCQGPSGHNVEYLLRLANFMRQHFPGAPDDHLFDLETNVLRIIDEKQMCLNTLMGSGEGCVTFQTKQSSRETSPTAERGLRRERVNSFEHTARVPGKKLRCLNI